MKKFITLLSLLSLFYAISFAQTYKIAGNFTDWAANAITMTRIGTGDVYKTTAVIPAIGTYEYKVMLEGDYINESNRKFTTVHDNQEITFYTKKGSDYWHIFCDAQEIYLHGTILGSDGWNTDNAVKLTNADGKAYHIGDLATGEYKLIVKNCNPNIDEPAFFLCDIMLTTQNLGPNNKYQITLDYETMSITAQALSLERIFDSHALVNNTNELNDDSKRYSVIAESGDHHHYFHEGNLSGFCATHPLYIGGETYTHSRIDRDMTNVKIFCKLNNYGLEIHRLDCE